jgi:hypothetical protein
MNAVDNATADANRRFVVLVILVSSQGTGLWPEFSNQTAKRDCLDGFSLQCDACMNLASRNKGTD